MSAPRSPQDYVRLLWRRIRWHRRPLIALGLALAAFGIMTALRPAPSPTTVVWTAGRDIPAGTRLASTDLISRAFPTTLVPAQAVDASALIGHTLTATVSKGSPLTSLSVIGQTPSNGAVVAVRLQDPALAVLLQPGDHVQLAAVDPHDPNHAAIIADAVVITVPTTKDPGTSGLQGRLVIFRVPAKSATTVAANAVSRYLTVIWSS